MFSPHSLSSTSTSETPPSSPSGYDITTDPIAIFSFILLVSTVIMFLYLVTCTTRLSSHDIWDQTRQRRLPSLLEEAPCSTPPIACIPSTIAAEIAQAMQEAQDPAGDDEQATSPLLRLSTADSNHKSDSKAKPKLLNLPRVDTAITRKNVRFSNGLGIQSILPLSASRLWEPLSSDQYGPSNSKWTKRRYEQLVRAGLEDGID